MPHLNQVRVALAMLGALLATPGFTSANQYEDQGEYPSYANSEGSIRTPDARPARRRFDLPLTAAEPAADHSPRPIVTQSPYAAPPANAYATPAAAAEPIARGPAQDVMPQELPQHTGAIPLLPPSERREAAEPPRPVSAGGALTTIISSLAIVLGLFFLVVFVGKRSMPKGMRQLPTEAFEVLGRATLGGKQQVQLIRLGGKLVLLSSTAAGVETITEIDDADEVQRIASICLRSRDESVSASFRSVLNQFGDEPASGFVDDETSTQTRGRRNRRGDSLEEAV